MTGPQRLLILVGAAFIVAGCSDGQVIADLETRVEELETQNSELRIQLDEDRRVATSTTSTSTTTSTTIATTTTTSGPTLVDMDGHFDLVDNRNWQAEDDGCIGEGGFADLSEVFQLSLISDTGETLGVVNIGLGEPHEAGDLRTDYEATFCRFSFVFHDVPLDSDFYTVASRRGDVIFERDQALGGLILVIGNT